jgi:ribosomal protein L3
MDRRAELLEVIRSVRNRWRQRLLVRGAVPGANGGFLMIRQTNKV